MHSFCICLHRFDRWQSKFKIIITNKSLFSLVFSILSKRCPPHSVCTFHRCSSQLQNACVYIDSAKIINAWYLAKNMRRETVELISRIQMKTRTCWSCQFHTVFFLFLHRVNVSTSDWTAAIPVKWMKCQIPFNCKRIWWYVRQLLNLIRKFHCKHWSEKPSVWSGRPTSSKNVWNSKIGWWGQPVWWQPNIHLARRYMWIISWPCKYTTLSKRERHSA